MGKILEIFFPCENSILIFWKKINNFLISQSWKKKNPGPFTQKKKKKNPQIALIQVNHTIKPINQLITRIIN
jgi:hypothetical protein